MGTITIFDKMWVTWRESKDENPLVYLTHYEDNKAFEKRKATGSSWASGRSTWNPQTMEYDKVRPLSKVFDNDSIDGFKIVKKETRYSTSNVVWRVVDPRGFTVEIYSDNFMNIISFCDIEKGEIKGKCVWGRVDGKNFLIPEASPDFKKSLSESVTFIPFKDINIGDTVKLKDGNKLIYVGKFYVSEYSVQQEHSWNRANTVLHSIVWRSTKNKRLTFIYDGIKNNPTFVFRSSNTIIEVLKKNDGMTCTDVDMILKSNIDKRLQSDRELKAKYPDSYRDKIDGQGYMYNIPTKSNDAKENEIYICSLGYKRNEYKYLIEKEI